VSEQHEDAGRTAGEGAGGMKDAGRAADEAFRPQAETVRPEPDGAPDSDAGKDDAAQADSSPDPAEGAADGEAGAEAGRLRAELEVARQQAEEFRQRWLRVQADFDNFRRRTRQEKEDLLNYASMGLIGKLLPVVDNFERALAAGETSKDFDSLYKGLEMTFRQLMQVLEQEGLKPIQAVGQPFDPEIHHAVMQVQADGQEEGIVVEEHQKGYKLKEKVLRPSMVSVSS